MISQTLRELEMLAQDLSRVEQGGVAVQQKNENNSQSDPQSVHSFVSFDSLEQMDSPKQLDSYLTRNNTELLSILRHYSPPQKKNPLPTIMHVPEEEEQPEEYKETSAPPTNVPLKVSSSLPRLPKISAVTKIERTSIGRLPKPNRHDLLVLGKLNQQFVENEHLDVTPLYKQLKESKRLDEFEVDAVENKRRRSSSKHPTRRHRSLTTTIQRRLSNSGDQDAGDVPIVSSDPGTSDEEFLLVPSLDESKRSPVTHFKKKLEHSFDVRERITNVIDDKMRRDRLDLPLPFVLEIKDDQTRVMFLKERSAVVIITLLKRVLVRRKSQYLKKWRNWNMYFARDRILDAANKINRIAHGKLGRMEAAERRIQQVFQLEAERQRQQELASLHETSAIDIQRVMRGWYDRGFAAIAKMHREGATCIQCFIRCAQAKNCVYRIRSTNTENFEGASTIQRFYRCCVAHALYKLKRRIRRAERAVEYAQQKTEAVRLGFERKGAANLISRWWRMLKVRMQFLRYRKLNKGRRTLKIQCAYRCYRGRVELTKRKVEHAAWLESRDRAASLVQSLYRSKKERERVAAMRAIIAAADGERRKRVEEAAKDKVKTFKFVGEVNMTKVHRSLFAFRKAVDPFQKNRELKATLLLQAYYRGNKARKRIRQQKMDHHLKLRRERKMARDTAALKLQTRWRSNKLRRIFLNQKAQKAAIHIQKNWRGYKGRIHAMSYLQHTFSSRTIQRVFRGYLGREYAEKKKEQRKRLGSKARGVQQVARLFLARQRVGKVRERTRYLEEVGLMGKEEFRVCRAHFRDEMMLESFKTTRGGSGIALMFFEALCSGGRHTVHGDEKKELRLGNTVVSRMCNDSHIIDEKRVKRNTVGILFAKAKAKDQAALNFREFYTFLKLVASTRYPKVDELRRAEGEDAQLLTLLSDHLLGGDKPKLHRRLLRTKLFRKMAKELDKMVDTELARLAAAMQAAIRGVQCRHAFVKLMGDHDKLIEKQRLDRAAQLIEAHIRKIFARKGAQKLASKTIQKFVDPITKEAYYYNPKTGVTSWDKPDILGSSDVVDPQVLPDKNVEFVVLCANCDKAVAESFCFPCGDGYCVDCFKSLHRKGKKASHPQTSIPRCHACLYQAASRRLVGANKKRLKSMHAKQQKNAPKTQFCDSCYDHRRHTELREAEEKGKTPPALAEWIVQPCAECEERSCRWKCTDCDDFYCTKCFSHVHARGNRATHRYTMLSYYTVEMERARMNTLRERIAKEAREIRLALEKQQKEEATNMIAIWGQARFRGWKGREYGLPFLKRGRAEMRRMYRVKKAEDRIRATIPYKLKYFIGAAPILESDDAATVARKKRAFLYDPKANVKHRLQRAVVFKLPKWMIGKELPGTVICRKGEPEAECSVDLTSHLKRGDRIRIGMGIFKIPTEGGFRRPDPDLDNMATIPNGGDVDPDTGLVKDAPPRFNHLFLPMDRPWAIPNEEQIKVYKISSRRPREPATTKIGKAWDAVSFLFSDESVPKQMAVGAKAGIQGVIAKVTTKIGKTTGGYPEKMGDFWTQAALLNASRAVIPGKTIPPLELDKRLWATTMDESSGNPYYTNRLTKTVTWEKPFSMMDMYEKREFQAKEAEERARLDEVAASKANAEMKKKEREIAKKAKEKRKRR